MLKTSVITEKNVYPDYYDAVASATKPHHFPSPVNDPEWLKPTVDWFVEAEIAMEVGPGRGEFAESAATRGSLGRYYIVDMSERMLDLVKARLEKVDTKTDLVFLHADVDHDPLSEIPDGTVDKIIMINAFQDINPRNVLREFRRVLKPGGLFRANVADRVVREETAVDDDLFDKENGYFYLTRNPGADGQKEVKPLGRITTKTGEEVPYYRMMRSYYRSELASIFGDCGFEILSEKPIILPKEVWMNSSAARGMKHNPKRQELMDKCGGYPGSIDIIARSSTDAKVNSYAK
jgi:ubiquinone/menaquinone biosynthesis C-methylase UbiE